MTFLIYIMLIKIYCEAAGSCEDCAAYALIGIVMWLGHCVAKYLPIRRTRQTEKGE